MNAPITDFFETSKMITAMSGTATTPLMTALQKRPFIGSIGEYWMTSAASTLDGDDGVKAARIAALAAEPEIPAHGLGERIGARAGEHRHAEQTHAHDAEREQQEREVPRERPERARGLCGGLDVGDAGGVQGDGGRQDDEVGREIRIETCRSRYPSECGCSSLRRRGRVAHQRRLRACLHVLDFLGGLPEEEVRD